ncbi:MAG: MFS transporter [Verrucomicrobiota bacterium]
MTDFAEIRGGRYPGGAGGGSRALGASCFSAKLRKPLLIGIALAILQQVTGINVFLYFGATIFKSHERLDRRGCRPAAADHHQRLGRAVHRHRHRHRGQMGPPPAHAAGHSWAWASASCAMGVMAQVVSRSCRREQLDAAASSSSTSRASACRVGPVTWVILSEIFPTAVRGRALGLATFFLWTADYVVTQTFPMMDAKDSWFVPAVQPRLPVLRLCGVLCRAVAASSGGLCLKPRAALWRRLKKIGLSDDSPP